MLTRDKLLRLLDDQHFQSGSELGQRLGITRAAVQQHIAALRDLRVPIVTAARQGYRLAPGVSLLDPAFIRRHLSDRVDRQVSEIKVLSQADSTNNVLLRKAQSMHGVVALAEDQGGGRGRRSKRWHATPYRNVMLSIAWVFADWPAGVTALGLVASLALARALTHCGVENVGIKWPNDLMWRGRKLGGILVDLAGEAGGACQAVIGVGLNVSLDPNDAKVIDQPWVDIAAIVDPTPERNRLAATVINELVAMLQQFPEQGFTSVASEWEQKHVLHNRQVKVITEQQTLVGQVTGVDHDGALLVQEPSGIQHRFFHGEVSVRT